MVSLTTMRAGYPILAKTEPTKDPADKAPKGRGRRAEAIIQEVLANPPSYQVLEEAYRMWLRKLIVASGDE